jgi:Macrocin-O-methyltransferase (TylF)
MSLKDLTSVIKSIPPLHRAARRAKRLIARTLDLEQPQERFFTLSPDVLVALVKALGIQQQRAINGRNLFDGHGYYEFGLFRGFSFWFAEQITRAYAGAGLHLFGFDSFAGLPQPDLAVEAAAYSKGTLTCSYEAVQHNLKKWRADESRISLFKGFYSDAMFRELRSKVNLPPISICLIDVDLYTSCVPVLEFIRHLWVEGSILLFDDYNHFGGDEAVGERRALVEFEARYPNFRKEHLFDYGWEGVAFRVLVA